MSSAQLTVLSSYRYDALDRLISQTQPDKPELQRFYCKSRLATEIEGALHQSIFQHHDQLLAQQQCEGKLFGTTLLATDLQRSVLNVLNADLPPSPTAYGPYGHCVADSGRTTLLGFNGERSDPMTGDYLLGNGYRAFSPVSMRFNSSDFLSPFNKGGINSYAYCLGDPINRTDANGRFSKFILAGISRWRGRLHVNALNRSKAVQEVAATGIVEINDALYSLKSNVTPVQAVKAHEKISYLNNLAMRQANLNGKFTDDFARASRESESFGKLTGHPARNYPRFQLLEYIQRRPDDPGLRGTFSWKRLDNISVGVKDYKFPLGTFPSVEEAIIYRKELSAASNSGHVIAMARQIRDAHFEKIVQPFRQ